MSFGKRTPGKPAPIQHTAALAKTRSPEPSRFETASEARRGTGMLKRTGGWMVFVGVTVLAAIVGLSLGIGKLANKKLANQFEYVGGEEEPILAVLHTPAAEGWALGGCTLSRPRTEMDEMREKQTGATVLSKSFIAVEFQDQSNFLECLATSPEMPLCASDVREAFAADAARFFTEYKSIAPLMLSFEADGTQDSAVNVSMKALMDAQPDFSESMRDEKNMMMASRERVADALKVAAQRGLISTNDFSVSSYFQVSVVRGKAEVTSIIDSVPKAESICKP
jgi:hypothetical protein